MLNSDDFPSAFRYSYNSYREITSDSFLLRCLGFSTLTIRRYERGIFMYSYLVKNRNL